MMFLRKRTVESTPSSFVKFARRASGVRTGAPSSTPTSDHVPEDTKAKGPPSGSAGTPTTADAVSWVPTATSGVASPDGERRPRPGTVMGPTTAPASTRRGKRASTPNPFSSACAIPGSHARAPGSSRPVVEALVTSVTASPVNQYASRSGMSSALRARDARASRVSATSWNTVLKGWNCRPLRSYSHWASSSARTAAAAGAQRGLRYEAGLPSSRESASSRA